MTISSDWARSDSSFQNVLAELLFRMTVQKVAFCQVVITLTFTSTKEVVFLGVLTLFRPFFFFGGGERGGGWGWGLRNSENINAMTTRLEG